MTSELPPDGARFRAAAVRGIAEGETISLLSPVTGEWTRLEGPARRIWERLDYPVSADALGAALGAEYDAPAASIRQAASSVLSELLGKGLIVEDDRPPDPMRDRYLGLLKRALANTLYPELELQVDHFRKDQAVLSGIEGQRFLRDIAERKPEEFARLVAAKQEGSTPYRHAHTMIGLFRLANIERCAERVFADEVEGDFLEAGVCRGGATVFMRALQIAHGAAERRTWVVDSFQGVPPSVKEVDRRYDTHLEESVAPWVACSETRVRELFSRYDMLDANVEFVAGWLAESLPEAPVGPLAILRVDVDLYSSTSECLDLLYDKVSPGGYVIVDDYGFFECCRDAVDDFRARRGIEEPFEWIDRCGIFWRKTGGRKTPPGR